MSLNSAPISWRSCLQGGVTLSSSEAEYVAASAVAQENTYLRALLSDFDRAPLGPTCVWENNAACILMSENPVNCDHSCHVDVKFHFLRERVRACESSYTNIGVPLMSPTLKACLSLLFIGMPLSCMEHAALTGLSPTWVSTSSFLFFLVSCASSTLSRH